MPLLFVGMIAWNAALAANANIEPKVMTYAQEFEWEERVVLIGTSTPPIQRELEEAYIRTYFADIPIMIDIAGCESTWVHTKENGEVLRGYVDPRDIGAMQVNTYYHLATSKQMGLDIFDFRDNLKYARFLYERNGTRDWLASRKCWSKV